jgi:hypothetical protein
MRSKAVADQDAWFLISSLFGFEIKYTLKPLQADLRVSISRVGAYILPSRGRKRGPIASMGTRWPDDHWIQIPTITTNALDCSHGCALNSRTSIVSLIMLTYKDFDGAWHREHHSSLVHIIYVLRQDIWIL